ncbi:hypothetical protein AMATHDRAFT_69965 [Amanita thiersii Skay4041]|uniref:Uncharacterized protein n=1 Tax=Amanita thiersii Skay4041 TaxID=703135 RepID=A0A2A9NFA2_9AGAR|nr:hypothetical protein AMATHDRAFT_69965 [Amanita thiersii Skay4041]
MLEVARWYCSRRKVPIIDPPRHTHIESTDIIRKPQACYKEFIGIINDCHGRKNGAIFDYGSNVFLNVSYCDCRTA